MDKYANPKTIGDGTYGSVLKAVNTQNGKTNSLNPALNYRRNCGNQTHEEEVQPVESMHFVKGDLIPYQAVSSQHSAVVRGDTGEEHPSLCF